MILSIFLAIGETWEDFKSKGQDILLKKYYIRLSKEFDHVYIFSYGQFRTEISKSVTLISNTLGLPRFVYVFVLPLIHKKILRQSSVIRGMQLTGGIPAVIAKFLYRKPVVINYGYDYAKLADAEGKMVQSFLYRIVEPIILSLVDKVIVTTKFLKLKLNHYAQKTVLIPNGIDTKLFKPLTELKVADILFVGRLEPQKNLYLLLAAASLVKRKVKITFVGSGSQQEALAQKAQDLGLDLKIVKPIPHDKLVKIYNRAKVFVLPSKIEGHPKALLESMSCESAVIGTDAEGIRNIINGRNGLLVPMDEKKISKSIDTLLQNRILRHRLGKNARRTVLKCYDLDKTLGKEMSLLKQLALTNQNII